MSLYSIKDSANVTLFSKAAASEWAERLTNCKNCGAVLHGSVCEYCGTSYASAGELENNKLLQMIAEIKSDTSSLSPPWYFSPSGHSGTVYGRDADGRLLRPVDAGQRVEWRPEIGALLVADAGRPKRTKQKRKKGK